MEPTERRPPRFVPTLTEVVLPAAQTNVAPLPSAATPAAPLSVGMPAAPESTAEAFVAADAAIAREEPWSLGAPASPLSQPAADIPTLMEEYLPEVPLEVVLPDLEFPQIENPEGAGFPSYTFSTPADLDRWDATVPLAVSPLPLTPAVALAPQALIEAALERVMARVDTVLEERLRYALSELVQLHTEALHQSLRASVEQVVYESVTDAVAQELAEQVRVDQTRMEQARKQTL